MLNEFCEVLFKQEMSSDEPGYEMPTEIVLQNNKCCELYDELAKSLDDAQRKLLIQLNHADDKLQGMRCLDYMKRGYKKGIAGAMKLMVEAIKE